MWVCTEVVDWWDGNRAQSEKVLEEFIENNLKQFGVIVATASTKQSVYPQAEP